MKKNIGFALITLALIACGDDKSSSSIPDNCQSYIDAVDKLVAKSPKIGEEFKKVLPGLKAQWEKIPSDQPEVFKNFDKSCNTMLESIKPMLNK